MVIYKNTKRVVIFVLGISVVLIGVVMIVAPGPAFVVIPAGLAILGTEFVWAKRLLTKLKQGAANMAAKVTGRPAASKSPPAESGR